MMIASEYYIMEFKSFKWLSSIVQTFYNHKQPVQVQIAHNIEYEKYRNFVPSEFQSEIIIFHHEGEALIPSHYEIKYNSSF